MVQAKMKASVGISKAKLKPAKSQKEGNGKIHMGVMRSRMTSLFEVSFTSVNASSWSRNESQAGEWTYGGGGVVVVIKPEVFQVIYIEFYECERCLHRRHEHFCWSVFGPVAAH